MTNAQKKIIRALRTLEKSWPTDGTMLMANGHALYLCTKHPQDGGKALESFAIPSDGGDPDWQDERNSAQPKKLPKFKPPRPEVTRTAYRDLGVEPPPNFRGKD